MKSIARPEFRPDTKLELNYRVPLGTVVTRDSQGNPLSKIESPYWEFASESKRKRLYFEDEKTENLSEYISYKIDFEIREVMYFLIHSNESEQILSVNRLRDLLRAVRKMATKCKIRCLSLREGLSDANLIVSLLGKGYVRHDAARISAIINKLNSLGALRTGFSIPIHKVNSMLKARMDNDKNGIKQHLPIPSRLYSKLISQISEELSSFEKTATELAALAVQAYCDKKITGPVSDELFKLFQYYGREINKRGIKRIVSQMSVLCEVAIITFSGMRAGEGDLIPFDCLTKEAKGAYWDYFLHGFTTKETNGLKKPTTWVIGEIGARAVQCAQTILGPVYIALGAGEKALKSGEHLLFCALGLNKEGYQPIVNAEYSTIFLQTILKKSALVLDANDIKELELVEGLDAFEDRPEVAIGKEWKFHKHQLRRSLVIYAQASGLVSLPSLKRQLQHLSAALTQYYGRGSTYAKRLTFDENGVIAEWRDNQILSSLLSFFTNISEEEELSGGFGRWLNTQEGKEFKCKLSNREETISMMKRGEFFFSATALGGCTNPDRCEINPIEVFPFECMENNCSKQIVSKPKLSLVIDAQRETVKSIEAILPNSPEHRIESNNLQRLETYFERNFS